MPERDLAVAMVTNRLHVPESPLRPTDEMFRIALAAAVNMSERETAWT